MASEWDEENPEEEESEPYDPFNIFPSGSPKLPGFSDMFSLGFGNHLVDCFFFTVGDSSMQINPTEYQEMAKNMISSIFGPQQPKVWKDKMLIKDELNIQYKNYKNSHAKYLIQEPTQYRGLFDMLN